MDGKNVKEGSKWKEPRSIGSARPKTEVSFKTIDHSL